MLFSFIVHPEIFAIYQQSKQNKKSEMVMALYNSGMKIADIMRNTELSRSTVNRIIKNHNSKAETITA